MPGNYGTRAATKAASKKAASKRAASKRAANEPGPSKQKKKKGPVEPDPPHPPAEPFDPKKMKHVRIIMVTAAQCRELQRLLASETESKEFQDDGALMATLPPQVNPDKKGGRLETMMEDETNRMNFKVQTLEHVPNPQNPTDTDDGYYQLVYEEFPAYVKDFCDNHVNSQDQNIMKEMLEKHTYKGRSIVNPPPDLNVEYASEATNLDPMDRSYKTIHPLYLGMPLKEHLLGGENFDGMTTPYIYFGTCGSVFFLHVENAGLFSVNILLHGAPKVWYVCSPKDASKVEEVIAKKMGRACHHYAHKTIPIDPQELLDAGVHLTKIIQRPGDIVITAPNAYHCGANTGFNVALAVNTILNVPLWRKAVRIGQQSVIWPGNPCLTDPDCENYEVLDVPAMEERAKGLTLDILYPPAKRITGGNYEDESPVDPGAVPKSKKIYDPVKKMGTIQQVNHILKNLEDAEVLDFLRTSNQAVARHFRGEFDNLFDLNFYYSAESPLCQAVLLTANAIDVKLKLKPIDFLAGEQLKPDFMKINPKRCVPTLDDKGSVLCESRAICISLATKYGKNSPLYPNEPEKRAMINSRLSFDYETMFKTFGLYLAVMVDDVPEKEVKLKELEEAYATLDSDLERQEWATAGSTVMTLSDIFLVASVSTAEAVGFNVAAYKNVSKWLSKCKISLPDFAEVNKACVDRFKYIFAKVPNKEAPTS